MRRSEILPFTIDAAPFDTVITARRRPYVGGVPLSVVMLEDLEIISEATSEASKAGLAALVASIWRYRKSYLVEPLELAETVTVAVVVFRTRSDWLPWLVGVAVT
jgi:hypothetical protein